MVARNYEEALVVLNKLSEKQSTKFNTLSILAMRRVVDASCISHLIHYYSFNT